MASSYASMWESLLPVGRNPRTGGYQRLAYSSAELACREWFVAAAQERHMEVDTDRNGNLWAWRDQGSGDASRNNALVIGSHLDSVRDGGAFDGPLGVVSSFAAIDQLRESGEDPSRPLAVVAFADEEGARFGIACAGSRLLTGQLDADHARALRDEDGVSMAEAMRSAGHDPTHLGHDEALLAQIGAYVELHVEQGRGLVDLNEPVGLASSIWPHGRYRFDFAGEANHAGTTRMVDRHDPVQVWARTAASAEAVALAHDARATFGRVEVSPNATNAVPSLLNAWLDARAADQQTLGEMLAEIEHAATTEGQRAGVRVKVTVESETSAVEFDASLRTQLATALGSTSTQAGFAANLPVLPTGAGHDAGVLSNVGIPTAMLFVRNPTGVSHSPAEFAEPDDCLAGVSALATVVSALTNRQD